jgi:hypothetical protein
MITKKRRIDASPSQPWLLIGPVLNLRLSYRNSSTRVGIKVSQGKEKEKENTRDAAYPYPSD